MNPHARSTLATYQTVAAHGGVAAADPHRLVLMLMDGALERIARARGCLQHGVSGDSNALLSDAIAIVDELRCCLDREAGGSIAANLDALYEYLCRQLMRANLSGQFAPLDEVSKLLGQIRDAWAALPADARARPATVAR